MVVYLSGCVFVVFVCRFFLFASLWRDVVCLVAWGGGGGGGVLWGMGKGESERVVVGWWRGGGGEWGKGEERDAQCRDMLAAKGERGVRTHRGRRGREGGGEGRGRGRTRARVSRPERVKGKERTSQPQLPPVIWLQKGVGGVAWEGGRGRVCVCVCVCG